MNQGLRAYRTWFVLGCLMLLTVIVLSLIRIEQPMDAQHADKYQHLLAYGCLMYWWGMVQPLRRQFWMIALPLLGLVLEWLQTLTAYRSMEWNDALANLLGVLLALVLLATPARRLLGLVDAKLADRLNPGNS